MDRRLKDLFLIKRIHGYLNRVRGGSDKKAKQAVTSINAKNALYAKKSKALPKDRRKDHATDIAGYRGACKRLKTSNNSGEVLLVNERNCQPQIDRILKKLNQLF